MARSPIDKLNADKQPKIVSPVPAGFPGWMNADSMVVSTPREVDGIVRRIPLGRLITLDGIRRYLAQQYQTDIACPVSTAIFINMAASAAEAYRDLGETDLTPYWRVLKNGGRLNPKYPGGVASHQEKLEGEGFQVEKVKGGYAVINWQDYLFVL